jgi:hypothetical protein
MKTKANREDWKIKPLPRKRKLIACQRELSAQQHRRLSLGLIPESMDDRWFIFTEGEWTQFHRSWTGYCIFRLRFEVHGGRWRIAESWANRDPRQYAQDDDVYDCEVLSLLIDEVLQAHGAHTTDSDPRPFPSKK